MCENGGNRLKLCENNNCNNCLNNSFASHEKAIFWSNKNIKTARLTFKSSKDKFFFDCNKCNHDFEIKLASLVYNNSWCHYCSNQKLCEKQDCAICLDKSFAKHPKAQFWSNKNEKKAREYFYSSEQKVYFDCDKCKHTFQSMIGNVTRGNKWCNFCSNTYLCEDTDCKICFEKSFASSEKAKFWSNKNEKKPRDVFLNSHDKYLFDCDKCKHIYTKSLNKISTDKTGCQYCSHQLLCDDDDCELCFDNSFASHPKVKFWSKKNTKNPGDVFKNSATKYWFDCHTCGHDYEKILCDMSRYDCPYCGCNILCSKLDCQTCFNKSFASSDKAKFLNPENNIDSRTIFKASEKKYEFICEKKHKFTSALNKVTCDNTQCPFCNRKTEAKLYDWLVEKYKNVEREKRFDWCKNKKSLPYDFYLPDLKLLIELDGGQHFIQVQNWQSPEKSQEVDKFKNDKAIENGYSIIRIIQEDVWFDKKDWEIKLSENIKIYDKPLEIKIGDGYKNL